MMKGALENITQAVGHTPIVKLNRVGQTVAAAAGLLRIWQCTAPASTAARGSKASGHCRPICLGFSRALICAGSIHTPLTLR